MDPQPDLVLASIGLGLCLFGWSLYWGGLHLAGATIGAGAGMAIGALAVEAGGFEHRSIILGAGAALGLLFGVFFLRRLHFGVLAAAGGITGMAAGLQIGLRLGGDGESLRAVAAGLGIVLGAILFIFFHRHVIIILTSLCGAILLDLGLMLKNPWIVPLCAFPLAWLFQTGVAWRMGILPRFRANKFEEG